MLGAPAAWAATPCHGLDRKPIIELRVKYGGVDLDTTKGRAQLAELGRESGVSTAGSGHAPMGLTRSQLHYQVRTETVIDSARGGHCASLTRADIEIGFADFKVYVDRRYRPGTCEYRAILDHENEHVRINRDALRRLESKISERVHAAIGRNPALLDRSPDEARQAHTRLIGGVLKPLVDEVASRARQGHDALDSRASYEKTYRLCEDW